MNPVAGLLGRWKHFDPFEKKSRNNFDQFSTRVIYISVQDMYYLNKYIDSIDFRIRFFSDIKKNSFKI